MKAILGSGLFLLLFQFACYAGNGESKDSAKKEEFVIVIPFKPQMYTVTGDYFICKTNEMTPGQLSEMIRKSLTSTLINGLGEHYNSSELGSTAAADGRSDLYQMYQVVRVRYKKKRIKAYYKGYPPFKLKEILAPRYKRWGSDCVNNERSTPNERKHKYAEAYIVNDSAFKQICQRNKAGYVLLITQFEMYTRFKTCLDLQQNVFQRDFYVHFTIFDKEGKRVDGGVVATTWESPTNDVRTILGENLGLLSGLMIDMCRKNFDGH